LSISDFVSKTNPIQIFILITFLNGVFSLKRQNRQHLFLLLVLFDGLLTEIISITLQCFNMRVLLLYSVSFIIYHSLWLLIITSEVELKSWTKIILSSFITFGLANFFFIEKYNLNYLTFIVGALTYISLFLYHSYHQLNRENLSYFTKNEYLLLFIPILFFFGLSFIFGFRNSQVIGAIVYHNVSLYTFIGYFVNIVYYSLANLYIYKERKSSVNHEH
jgi:hypothetical protein